MATLCFHSSSGWQSAAQDPAGRWAQYCVSTSAAPEAVPSLVRDDDPSDSATRASAAPSCSDWQDVVSDTTTPTCEKQSITPKTLALTTSGRASRRFLRGEPRALEIGDVVDACVLGETPSTAPEAATTATLQAEHTAEHTEHTVLYSAGVICAQAPAVQMLGARPYGMYREDTRPDLCRKVGYHRGKHRSAAPEVE